MECIYCKGRMQKATAPFSIERKGYHIHWDAIPAWVCTLAKNSTASIF